LDVAAGVVGAGEPECLAAEEGNGFCLGLLNRLRRLLFVLMKQRVCELVEERLVRQGRDRPDRDLVVVRVFLVSA